MFRDGWGFMMRKYAADAQERLAERQDRYRQILKRRQAVAQRNRVLKMVFLGVALLGVAYGLYYAHELGGMIGSTVSRTQFNLPAVEAPPPISKAKMLRKLSERKRARDEDLAEIENF